MQGVPRDVAETVLKAMSEVEKIWKSADVEGLEEKCRPLWSIISHEVLKQKRRLGGDFAIAQAVVSRDRKSIEKPIHSLS